MSNPLQQSLQRMGVSDSAAIMVGNNSIAGQGNVLKVDSPIGRIVPCRTDAGNPRPDPRGNPRIGYRIS